MNAIEQALEAFRLNLREMQRDLAERTHIIAGHRHGILCFPWRWCRVKQREIRRIKKALSYYGPAIEGLERQDPGLAIEYLEKKRRQFRESNLRIAHRLAHSPEPTLTNMKITPVGVYTYLTSLIERLTQYVSQSDQ